MHAGLFLAFIGFQGGEGIGLVGGDGATLVTLGGLHILSDVGQHCSERTQTKTYSDMHDMCAGGCSAENQIHPFYIGDADMASICSPPPGESAPFLPPPGDNYECLHHKVCHGQGLTGLSPTQA